MFEVALSHNEVMQFDSRGYYVGIRQLMPFKTADGETIGVDAYTWEEARDKINMGEYLAIVDELPFYEAEGETTPTLEELEKHWAEADATVAYGRKILSSR